MWWSLREELIEILVASIFIFIWNYELCERKIHECHIVWNLILKWHCNCEKLARKPFSFFKKKKVFQCILGQKVTFYLTVNYFFPWSSIIAKGKSIKTMKMYCLWLFSGSLNCYVQFATFSNIIICYHSKLRYCVWGVYSAKPFRKDIYLEVITKD